MLHTSIPVGYRVQSATFKLEKKKEKKGSSKQL